MSKLAQVDITGELIEAKFIKRLNRFVAEISIDNEIHLSHVPNTGRMIELLVPGANIIVRRIYSIERKTKFDLLMVNHNGILVLIDSAMPNKILFHSLKNYQLPFFKDYIEVVKEVKYKNSRFDIALKGNINTLIEAKCVTYVDKDVARFPDAPTERGTKHVLELIESIEDGFEAAVIFVIQREDAQVFMPNHSMDPKFSKALKLAAKNNVKIKAIKCNVTDANIQLLEEIEVKL
ncbi:DNA/RNA nuclease SfsA [Clostridium sp. D2Q-11]|uniref:Sugar fermentation stimulation protein homolog n=1 Tax=Anaeromonas frigoriresistens TaxID=2683708 RepID=A0A942ZA64_9FIRM|nr:DNA/RNA nuclease SfsA [Anaeromonas frigoriresistens]MBS4540038.1 DNA/RNA nuclease SfsA [Anaeromonas frigoriresistens]